MKSKLPKVLHQVAGKPLVAWAIDSAFEAGVDQVLVVVGNERAQVEAELSSRYGDQVKTVVQAEQNGTGHAVGCAFDAFPDLSGQAMILYGDCPLVPVETLKALVDGAGDNKAALVTGSLENPFGYGRILRNATGEVVAIREHKDCSADELKTTEVNPGLYLFDIGFAREAMKNLSSENAAGELYLTDLIAMAAEDGGVVDIPGDMPRLRGVNNRRELAECEATRQRLICDVFAESGVGFRDLNRVVIDADVEIEADAFLEADVQLRGKTKVAAGAFIEQGAVITDSIVGKDAHVKPYCVLTESELGESATVGPFAHLRPGSVMGPECKVGNFVEMKKTTMERGAKASHLAYLGDGEIGEGVNIGAGTIFCNYDGVRKNKTILEKGVFIGSDSQLVAPVRVGEGAYVGSGSTITRDVPANALAVSRTKQINKEGYAERLRARFEAEKKRNS